MSELYRKSIAGIGVTCAMQVIRKIVRGKEPDAVKLKQICEVVHEYEEDTEQAELAAERRAIEEDEAKLRRERIDDMFEGMAEPLNKLTIRKPEGK